MSARQSLSQLRRRAGHFDWGRAAEIEDISGELAIAGVGESLFSGPSGRQAVEMEETADEVREQLRNELASYESGKPWRERQEVPEGGEAAARPADAIKPGSDKPAETAARDTKPRRPFDD